MNTVSIPWPDKKLHPNTRTDRRHTGAIRKRYRSTCWALAKNAKIDPALHHLDITFFPPDKRKRDLDGMLGAIKYGLDGIAMALGVDDYEWSMSIRRGPSDKTKAGYVLIEFTQPQTVVLEHRGEIT